MECPNLHLAHVAYISAHQSQDGLGDLSGSVCVCVCASLCVCVGVAVAQTYTINHTGT